MGAYSQGAMRAKEAEIPAKYTQRKATRMRNLGQGLTVLNHSFLNDLSVKVSGTQGDLLIVGGIKTLAACSITLCNSKFVFENILKLYSIFFTDLRQESRW